MRETLIRKIYKHKGILFPFRGVVIMKIKEVSHYSVYDSEGNLLKKKFKDLHDAHEYGVNKILSGKYDEVIIRGEIKLSKK